MDKRISVLGCSLAILIAGPAGLGVSSTSATLTQVGSSAALGSNLVIDWSAFGPAGTNLSCFCSTPVGPLTVGINGSSGLLNRVNEGTNYVGNFTIGNALLAQPFVSDQMFVSFATPVSAVGTQLQPLSSSQTPSVVLTGLIGPFTGTMQVFTDDGMDASFTVAGTGSHAEDGSASFIGVTSTTSDITGVTFYANVGNPMFPEVGSIAINAVDVRVGAVPEPPSALLLVPAIGAMLLAGAAGRRRAWSS